MSKLSVIYLGLCAAVLTAGLAVQSVQGGATPSQTGFSENTLRAVIDATGQGPH
ncbi:MAG: hypothetical protein RID15_01550 [Marinovum algicola]|jgi:hypothetical protein|uniref:Uncharacterized protein n=1 Tax=Marinovum algicola TaxID=42444 RepID=A0A975W8R3_9RHOB|nr:MULTISPECIES: hypothetical protein [Marinovum]AKO98230.1 hypothetical protein MALG_03085 [Marinovum algicola DG 898]MDD9742241.1 hypothetical protein [Marinovum sp. SP66]MDD9744529.1 hypothetical protein [Marinovum sp. PR37]SEJ19180.1 hypothetical protein SAMN04487940_10411 [Marinovum algicola]SLN75424.1 hypothetical protein MAA5396_04478 [Marinovum algicola]